MSNMLKHYWNDEFTEATRWYAGSLYVVGRWKRSITSISKRSSYTLIFLTLVSQCLIRCREAATFGLLFCNVRPQKRDAFHGDILYRNTFCLRMWWNEWYFGNILDWTLLIIRITAGYLLKSFLQRGIFAIHTKKVTEMLERSQKLSREFNQVLWTIQC